MKFSIAFIILFLTFFSLSQDKETLAKELWHNNLQEIMLLEKVNVLNHTHFPLEGEWASVHNIEGAGMRQDFMANMEEIFPEQMRINLKTEDPSVLQVNEVKGKVEFIRYIYTERYSAEEEYLESSIIFTFKLIQGIWMLTAINYAG